MAFASSSPLAVTHPRMAPRRPRMVCMTSAPRFFVCTGPSCRALGSKLLAARLCALADADVAQSTGCLGECGTGPNVGCTSTGEITHGVIDVHTSTQLLQSHGFHINHVSQAALALVDGTDNVSDEEAGNALETAANALRKWSEIRVPVLVLSSQKFLTAGLAQRAADVAEAALEINARAAPAWLAAAKAWQNIDEERAARAWRAWGRAAGKRDEGERQARKLERGAAWFG